jgi:hypothetical protein
MYDMPTYQAGGHHVAGLRETCDCRNVGNMRGFARRMCMTIRRSLLRGGCCPLPRIVYMRRKERGCHSAPCEWNKSIEPAWFSQTWAAKASYLSAPWISRRPIASLGQHR